MKTHDLITAIARDAGAVPSRAVEKRLALAALGALILALLVVLAAFGLRTDLASVPAAVVLKATLVLAVLGPAASFALRAARPATTLGGAAAPVLLAAAASALAAIVVTVLTAGGERLAALFPTGFPPCLWSIPITAAPGAVVVFWAVRSLGPTRLALAGAAAGATAGALGALAYCLHCPIDSPAYVLAWYPAAIAICAGGGALAGPHALRW
jgi:hypothetical protein